MTRFIHASAVLIGEAGLLITGASGSGKSALALALLGSAARRGQSGRLIGDDRIAIMAVNGRLLARGHPAISGLIERRGFGIERYPHEPAALIRLVAIWRGRDYRPARLPLAADAVMDIEGISLPCLNLPSDMAIDEACASVVARL